MTSRISSSRLPASSGDVSDRPVILPPGFDRLANDEAASAKRIRHCREHDRDDRGRLFRCEHRRSRRDNDIDHEPHEFGGDLRENARRVPACVMQRRVRLVSLSSPYRSFPNPAAFNT